MTARRTSPPQQAPRDTAGMDTPAGNQEGAGAPKRPGSRVSSSPDEIEGWTTDGNDTWRKILRSEDGEPPLYLRVFPTPDAFAWEAPWTWEITEVCEGVEETEEVAAEIDAGVAPGREAAMLAAIVEARFHVAGLADE